MSTIEHEAVRGFSAQTLRRLIGFAAVAALMAVIVTAIFLIVQSSQVSRAEEAELLAAFNREVAAENAAMASKLSPDRVIWPISGEALANGFNQAAVTKQVRAYQADNAQSQALVRKRGDALGEKLSKAGFGRSRQKKAVEAFEARRDPSLATRAFLLRHELGEEVLIVADLLERRRGAWRMDGDQIVFVTNADRQLYEQALRRQQEIRTAIPDLKP